MHNDIITQNVKLNVEKLIFEEEKILFETINGIKYRFLEVSRESESACCSRLSVGYA